MSFIGLIFFLNNVRTRSFIVKKISFIEFFTLFCRVFSFKISAFVGEL